MRVLVCGGRDFTDQRLMESALEKVLVVCGQDAVLIHGDARGADRMAGSLGRRYGWRVWACPADWNAHGKKAGPLRNARMLREANPQLVLAFPTAQSRGTYDMIRRAEAASFDVEVYKQS